MQAEKAFLAATLSVLWISGCNGTRNSPAEPGGGINTFALDATLSNAAGAPTIVDAKLFLDKHVIEDNGGSPPRASAEFNNPSPNTIAEGSHFLDFMIASQTTVAPTTYIVPAFTFTVYTCVGDFIEDIDMPTQTATLTAGQVISYRFDTPALSGDTCGPQTSAAAAKSVRRRQQPRGHGAPR